MPDVKIQMAFKSGKRKRKASHNTGAGSMLEVSWVAGRTLRVTALACFDQTVRHDRADGTALT